MTPTSETVTQLLLRRAEERASGGMAYASLVMAERTAGEISKITGTRKEDWWKR